MADFELRTRFEIGKIPFQTPRRSNMVELDVALTKRGGEKTTDGRSCVEYVEFTASACVWNTRHTDILMGGQCLDELVKHYPQITEDADFMQVYTWWKRYHLNAMHAGMPEQEDVLQYAGLENAPYEQRLAYLKSMGLFEVPYRDRKTIGLPHDPADVYRYGHGWVISDIPPEAKLKMAEFIIAKRRDEDRLRHAAEEFFGIPNA